MRYVIFSALILALGLTACGSAPAPDPQTAPAPTDSPLAPTEIKATQETSPLQEAPLPKAETMPVFALTSSAFAPEADIPVRFSCDGDDISPQLAWTTPPVGTQSLALIMDDPDAPAGTWVHWVLYNIPAETTKLAENLPEVVAVQGKNSWKRLGYAGPCPPSGTHRYYFKLYALDTMLNLQTGASKEDVLSAMDGHVLAQAELTGTFGR
ncbi:MAG: YbhB/YbcL family Raf kinase inhibitor-like protein [Anaerolineales bacterium]|nr:YbhB/YbcL family Raf kinase inhibitor-like protein [Anaerolineales bacterium]